MPSFASAYPGSIDGASNFGNPVDRFSTGLLQTTLAAQMLATDLSGQLSASPASLGMAATFGVVSIENELILYGSVQNTSPYKLLTCTRGFNGTTAVTHAAGTPVYALLTVAFLQALQAAIIAIETLLGTTGAFNFCLGVPGIDQTVSGALTLAVGSNAPAVVQDAMLKVRLVQDGTGHAVTFTTGFQGIAALPANGIVANVVSVLLFTGGADGNWWLAGMPIIGLHQ